MSIKVELADIENQIEGRGAGYLLSTGPDNRPHLVQVFFEVADGALTAPAGRKTCRNIASNSLVALLWTPEEPGDYSLIVDADAEVYDLDSDGKGFAKIKPTGAILHRPAESGGHDCKPVPES